MGMAASQARFLTLTARKSNVEYEGQQVNQQRTSLSNESAGLFNKMMALQVPTPPSSTDFYNTRYTFSSGGSDYSIYDFQPNNDGTYKLSIEYATTADVGRYYGTNCSIQTNTKDEPVTITVVGSTTPIPLTKLSRQEDGSYHVVNADGTVEKDADPNMPYIIEASNSKADTYYRYESNKVTYYASGANVKDFIENKDPNSNLLATYYMSQKDETAKVSATGTIPEKTEEGRFQKLVISNVDSEDSRLVSNLTGKEFELSLSQVQDDEGYAEAMKDYEYQKMLYERTINDINAQTEIIQQQDRTLELRLKQLDTEQNALNTELEAVKKVIETNVEATFKTFA